MITRKLLVFVSVAMVTGLAVVPGILRVLIVVSVRRITAESRVGLFRRHLLDRFWGIPVPDDKA